MSDVEEAAKRAVELANENDYSLRVACTHASWEYDIILKQHEVWNRARK